jgi:Bacterial regulatory proteins, luxR family
VPNFPRRPGASIDCRGKANKQIASELESSIKTVEKHRQRLMQELGIDDIAGLTRYAVAAGVIESNVIAPLMGGRKDSSQKHTD